MSAKKATHVDGLDGEGRLLLGLLTWYRTVQPDIFKTVMIKAVSTSLLTKGVGAAYQVLSLPFLMAILSEKDFGTFALLSSLVGWVMILQGGVGPSITRLYAKNASGRIKKKVEAVTSSIILIYGLATVVLAVLYLVFFEPEPPLAMSIVLLSVLSSLTLYFSIAESVRLGLHQQHINNLVLAAGNLLILIALYGLSAFEQLKGYELICVVLAVYAPPFLLKVVNTLAVYKEQTSYFSISRYKSNKRMFLIVGALIASVVFIQVSGLLVKTASLLYLGVVDVVEAGRLEVVYRILTILGTFYPMIQVPLWPLLVKARNDGDKEWVAKVCYSIIVGFSLFGVVCAIALAMFGSVVIEYWLGNREYFSDSELLALSFYFFAISVAQAYVVLYMGYECFSKIARVLMCEAIIYASVLLGSLLFDYLILLQMLWLLVVLRVGVGVTYAYLFHRREGVCHA